MIQWLVQSATEHGDLSRGIAPPGLLHPIEQQRLAELKLSKRRSEWLIGRWTAKHLLQACLEREAKMSLPLNAIGIYNDARGAPVAMIACGSCAAEWAISISHSHARGFSAAVCDSAIGLGADMELSNCASGALWKITSRPTRSIACASRRSTSVRH